MTIFLIIICILLVMSYSRNIRNDLKDVTKQLSYIKRELNNLKMERRDEAVPKPPPISASPTTKEKEAQKEKQEEKTEVKEEIKKEEPKEPVREQVQKTPEPEKVFAARTQQVHHVKSPVGVKREKKPSFMERNPDLEKFIGENLINKIGIVILVIGIGFFVKYAIDKEWINEIGRTFIGILCGGILVGLAHYLRKSFKAFSSVLIGGGLAIFYFTIAIAFHEYRLLNQTAAFAVMVLITAFAVLLSITYDRKELTILSMLGGYATPFMVSSGEGNYLVLFTYITILNTGMLVLAYFKKWNVVNTISYIFTILLFGGWLVSRYIEYGSTAAPGALAFATVFYLQFFTMNIINNLKKAAGFKAQEFLILLSNTFLYFSAGIKILYDGKVAIYQGLFTLLIGAFNFLFAFFLYRRKEIDKNLIYMLIGLVLTFVSMAVPIQMDGNYITLFWAMEAVLLLWLGQKSNIQLIKLASLIVMTLMIINLANGWLKIYLMSGDTLDVFLNRGFITNVVAVLSVVLTRFLLNKESGNYFLTFTTKAGRQQENYLENKMYRAIAGAAITILLYLTFLFEFNYQLDQFIEFYPTRIVILASYHFVFIIALSLLNRKRKVVNGMVLITLYVLCLIDYLSYIHFSTVLVRNSYLVEGASSIKGFLYHYVDLLLIVAIMVLFIIERKALFKAVAEAKMIFYWIIAFIVVYLVSCELDHLYVLSNYYPGLKMESLLARNHKFSWPVAWSICSFIFMLIGMRRKIRDLRIISLSLFTVVILKLFLLDLRGMSEGGKIAAFVSLGVLLLTVSFMYQRLKKLIIDDDEKGNPGNQNEEE